MENFPVHPQNQGMEITETQKLLAQARAICLTVTGKDEVPEALLLSVFDRLCLELDTKLITHANDLESSGNIH